MERVKTPLLMVLVAVSILLTTLLCSRLPGTFLPQPAAAAGAPAALPPGALAPDRIVLHAGGTSYLLYPGTPLYADVWRMAGPILAAATGSGMGNTPRVAGGTVATRERSGYGYSFEWLSPLPLGAWSADYRGGGKRVSDRIDLVFSPHATVYVLGSAESFRMRELPPGGRQKLLDLARGLPAVGLPSAHLLTRGYGLELASAGAFAPEHPVPLNPVSVRAGKQASLELLPRFFSDPATVREIQERQGGGVVYTDGFKALRVLPSGVVEYSAPDQGRPPGGVLAAAESFLSRHDLWPPAAALAGLNRSGPGGGEVTFRYRFNGLPVTGGEVTRRVQVRGGYAVRFTFFLGQPGGALGAPRPTLSAHRVLQLLAADNPGGVLEGLYQGYWAQGGELHPAWIAQMAGEQLVVDAFDGKLLGRGEG
ncbi:MAG: hypothetical protein M0031_06300 [Thermaerobacter sp.]|nr:hypothetical protein [Thermaerobacter sp.]